MVGLLDIAPPEASAKTIQVRGVALRIQGIVALEWARLYARFPDLRHTIEGRPIEDGSPAAQIAMQAAVIAAGSGAPGDPLVERAAVDNLTAAEAADIMQQIVRLSLPGDIVGPLREPEAEAAPPGDAAATG